MHRLTTHYDNPRVSRHAPQEVIRAAYKALSQKYHPDKHPDDPRTTRIMTLVNQSYAVLSDTRQRREHDAWIEEAEYDLLTQSSPQTELQEFQQDEANAKPSPRHAGWRWWGLGMVVCAGLGWGVGMFMARPTSDPPSFTALQPIVPPAYVASRSIIFAGPVRTSGGCVTSPTSAEASPSCVLSQRHDDTQLWVDVNLSQL